MFYKKDISNKLIVFTILLFAGVSFLFHIILGPFRSIENDLTSIEKDIISKDWDAVISGFDKVNDTWSKYEVVLRILNSGDVTDEFELHLDQCILLSKYKKDMVIEHLSILQDDVSSMVHIIPNP